MERKYLQEAQTEVNVISPCAGLEGMGGGRLGGSQVQWGASRGYVWVSKCKRPIQHVSRWCAHPEGLKFSEACGSTVCGGVMGFGSTGYAGLVSVQVTTCSQ